jgi:hypothetical protein
MQHKRCLKQTNFSFQRFSFDICVLWSANKKYFSRLNLSEIATDATVTADW